MEQPADQAANQPDANNNNEAPKPNLDDMNQALNLYDVCIKITTLMGLIYGWGIVGCKAKTLGDIFAQFIGVIGDYKTGKTFICSQLLDIFLPRSQTFHTPGICLKLPSGADDPPPAAPTATQEETEAAAKRRRWLEKKNKAPKQVESAPSSSQILRKFCILDADGTDKNASGTAAMDQQATEFFLKSMIVELSSRVLYVTNRWGSHAMSRVRDLILQLEDSEDTTKIPSDLNRVIVIHNLLGVTNLQVLKSEIQEVEKTYILTDMNGDVIRRDIPYWVPQAPEGYEISYLAEKTNHFFLINDDCEVGKTHNVKVFAALRSLLTTSVVQKRMNFLEAFLEKANMLLRHYIKDWKPEYHLHVAPDEFGSDPDQLAVLPTTSDPNDEEAFSSHLELQQLELTGHSVISEGTFRMPADLNIDEIHLVMEVVARCPGLTKDDLNRSNITFYLDPNSRWVEMRVEMPEIGLPTGVRRVLTTCKYGQGIFKATLPEPHRFQTPKDLYSPEHLSIQDGLLRLKIPLRSDVLTAVGGVSHAPAISAEQLPMSR